MASEITDHDPQISPAHDDTNGNGLGADVSRGIKRQRPAHDDDDDDDDKGRERRKIEIKFIADKSRRHITFSKRKAGIMKKVRVALLSCWAAASSAARVACIANHIVAELTVMQAYELSVLTGTQVLLLVVSETGLVYTFTTPKLQPLVTKSEGKNLIQVRPSIVSCYEPS
jgi:pheromone receptor transcription factor